MLSRRNAARYAQFDLLDNSTKKNLISVFPTPSYLSNVQNI